MRPLTAEDARDHSENMARLSAPRPAAWWGWRLAGWVAWTIGWGLVCTAGAVALAWLYCKSH